jgi:restriction system protein
MAIPSDRTDVWSIILRAGVGKGDLIALLVSILLSGLAAFGLSVRLAVPWVVSVTLIALANLVLRVGLAYLRGRRARAIRLSEIDGMPGVEFEEYLAGLLTDRGYAVTSTPATGDLGVDLIATDEAGSTAIQVKRTAGTVSRRAVSDAVAGVAHYGCAGAMVITNGYFTKGAVELAASTKCVLVDRDELSSWILALRSGLPWLRATRGPSR